MKALTLIGIATGALALTACSTRMENDNTMSKAPAATVVGEARSCIPVNQISSSRVHDDRTIDFKVGRQTYRNTLPQRCSGLGYDKAFSYKTSLSQLCNTDIIRVLHQVAGSYQEGAGCGLGQFVPIEYDKSTKG
ncbi:hypothetical protein MB02_02090 [Croceicoccus estronivorus]|uniref:hypothetical protein n=1 Tax=Croceicoccus estronivorus TaxID=1172626 RepID=UPI00082A2BA4|nr:hypothetical protein [Croceicoccus estronivorus]OCC25458.1 hypothetical protein MB02_02090 [Croceicoccus estronivorus]